MTAEVAPSSCKPRGLTQTMPDSRWQGGGPGGQFLCFSPAVPSPQDLIPDALRWRCYNNTRSKVHSGFLGVSDGKEPDCNAGDSDSISGSGRSPGEGNDNPLQSSSWRIPWTEEAARLQSLGSQRVQNN